MASPRPERSSVDLALLEGLATTRTIRRYTADPVPDEDLSEILWHATRAPSGSNRQPVRYVVVRHDGPGLSARALLAEAARAEWAWMEDSQGYRERTGTDPSSPKSRMRATMREFTDHFADIPVIVMVCNVRYRPPTPTEGGSVYPAVQNLLLAARALGYGGAVTMWFTSVEERLREVLGIPADVGLAACVTLGRPVGGHGAVRRRPLADVVFDGGWGEPAPWAVDPPGTRHTQPR